MKKQIRVKAGPAIGLSSDQYKGIGMLIEPVQNDIDGGATKIFVHLDLKEKTLTCCGNGSGLLESEFAHAMESVFDSNKKDDNTKYGQYAMGFFASANYCERFSFTFCKRKKASLGYQQSVFESSEILTSWEPSYEINPCSRLTFSSQSQNWEASGRVPWTTRLFVDKIHPDSDLLSVDINSLADLLREVFSETLRSGKLEIKLKITRKKGVEEKTINQARQLGKVVLQQRWKSLRAGQITVSLHEQLPGRVDRTLFSVKGDMWRFPPEQLFTSMKKYLGASQSEGVIKLLKIFSGNITAESVKLTPSRKNFAANQAREGLFDSLLHLYEKKGGKELVKQYENQANALAFDSAAKTAFENISRRIIEQEDSISPELRRMLNSLTGGAEIVLPTSKRRIVLKKAKKEEPSLADQIKRKASELGNVRVKKTQKKKTPLTHTKKVFNVTFGSFGKEPYLFDFNNGELRLNTLYPDFVTFRRKKRLSTYIEMIGVEALTTEAVSNPVHKAAVKRHFSSGFRTLLLAIINEV